METNEIIELLLKEKIKDRNEYQKKLSDIIKYFYELANEEEKENLKEQFKNLIR